MLIEEQVLNIEQMQHLKELGLEVRDTALCWYNLYGSEYNPWKLSFDWVSKEAWPNIHFIPTLTLQEILELLPPSIVFGEDVYDLVVKDFAVSYQMWMNGELIDELVCSSNKKVMDSAYKTLCWVIENGYLKIQ